MLRVACGDVLDRVEWNWRDDEREAGMHVSLARALTQTTRQQDDAGCMRAVR